MLLYLYLYRHKQFGKFQFHVAEVCTKKGLLLCEQSCVLLNVTEVNDRRAASCLVDINF